MQILLANPVLVFFFLLILVLSLLHVMRVWFRSRERFLGLSVVVIIMVSNLVITDAEE